MLKYVRFCYATTAIHHLTYFDDNGPETPYDTIRHSQFLDCNTGVLLDEVDLNGNWVGGLIDIRNALFAYVTWLIFAEII